ncbi:MAG: hypothetical protein DMF97_10625, partial [Acidobacteria bacterium]
MRTIAAPFERQPLQKGRRNTFDANGVTWFRMAKIDFEATAFLCCGNRQQHTPGPRRFARGRVDQQVWHGP